MASLDRKVYLGTDGASFYIFHPDDLAHRKTSPIGWVNSGFACRKEFEAGRLVGWCTGGDGGYGFRLSDTPLTRRELAYRAGSWEFRLRVRYGRVLLDNANCIPNSWFPNRDLPEDNDGCWVSLPNGDYRVTIHAIEWTGEAGSTDANGQPTENALQNYVIQFEAISDIGTVPIKSSAAPRLDCDRNYEPQRNDGWPTTDLYVADRTPPPSNQIAILEDSSWLVEPGFGVSMTASDELYDAIHGTIGSEIKPDRLELVVLAPKGAKSGDFGVLARPGGASRMGDEPWSLGFNSLRLVRLVDIKSNRKRGLFRFFKKNDENWPKATVAAVEQPVSVAHFDDIDTLKKKFTAFAQNDTEFRNRNSNPDYLAEQVAAMESPESLTHALIHYLPLTDADRLRLLLSSDADRVRSLSASLGN